MTRGKCRNIQITVMDARNLEAVLIESEMKVYAKISINGNPKTVKRTPVDKKGRRWPAWNFSVKYTLSENEVTAPGTMLLFKLYCKQTWKKDEYIGEVSVRMKDLFERSNETGNGTTVSYDVRRGAQLSQGEIKFSCAFSDVKTIKKRGAWKKWLAPATYMGFQVTSLLCFGSPAPLSVTLRHK